MKGMKCTQSQFLSGKPVCVHTAVSHWSKFFFFFVYKYCVGCFTQALLLHSSLVGNRTRWQVRGDGQDCLRRTGWRDCHGDEGGAC